MDARVVLERKLSAEELMLLNCGVGEVHSTSRRSNQSILKESSPGCSFRGSDVESEALILWTPDVKS